MHVFSKHIFSKHIFSKHVFSKHVFSKHVFFLGDEIIQKRIIDAEVIYIILAMPWYVGLGRPGPNIAFGRRGVAPPNPATAGWVEPQAGCAHSSQPRSRVAAIVASRPGPCCPFALLLPTPPLPALLSHGRRQPWLCPPWAATRVAHGPPQLVPVLGATLRTTLAASCTGGCGSAWT